MTIATSIATIAIILAAYSAAITLYAWRVLYALIRDLNLDVEQLLKDNEQN